MSTDQQETERHCTCFCLDRPVSECKALPFVEDASTGALNPAMAAAAAVAAAGKAGRLAPPAVAPEATAVVAVETPPCTSSATRGSRVALRPADTFIDDCTS